MTKVSLAEAKKAGITVEKTQSDAAENEEGVERAFMADGVQTEESVKFMLN